MRIDSTLPINQAAKFLLSQSRNDSFRAAHAEVGSTSFSGDSGTLHGQQRQHHHLPHVLFRGGLWAKAVLFMHFLLAWAKSPDCWMHQIFRWMHFEAMKWMPWPRQRLKREAKSVRYQLLEFRFLHIADAILFGLQKLYIIVFIKCSVLEFKFLTTNLSSDKLMQL